MNHIKSIIIINIEYVEDNLQTFISKNTIDFELLLKIANDIAFGMNYLHCKAPINIIHRDLKSNNSIYIF